METQGLVNSRSLKDKESKMSKHPNKVVELTVEELAEKFARTTYGYQLEFFKELSELYYKESMADEGRGYSKLSSTLYVVSNELECVIARMEVVWKICESKTEVEDEIVHELKNRRAEDEDQYMILAGMALKEEKDKSKEVDNK
jgi:hypothetical protein